MMKLSNRGKNMGCLLRKKSSTKRRKHPAKLLCLVLAIVLAGFTILADSGMGTVNADDIAVIMDNEMDNPLPSPPGNMAGLLGDVTITDESGNPIKDGTLYVGEEYIIKLIFQEMGAQAKQFEWNDDGKMFFQIPEQFTVTPQTERELWVEVDGENVSGGKFSVDENGLLTVELNEDGKQRLKDSTNIRLKFDMNATANATAGGTEGGIHFGDAGTGFEFKITDQPSLDMDKKGSYTENVRKNGGLLSYTVKATVEHGEFQNAEILDVLTPPQTTDYFEVSEPNTDSIKVTLTRADGSTYELKPEDYELELIEDPANPGQRSFRIKLKGSYSTLSKGDELSVTYDYNVSYRQNTTGLFFGTAENKVTVSGTMPVEDPDNPNSTLDFPVEQDFENTVQLTASTTGEGIIFKDQSFDPVTKTLHYTLYTVIPKGKWEPLYIQDDMTVVYNGKRWFLSEFKDGGRVSGLTVRAVDLNDDKTFQWEDNQDPDKLEDLRKLKENLEPLQGFDMTKLYDAYYDNNSHSTSGYDLNDRDQYVYRLGDHTLNIIFGFDLTKEFNEYWGNWGSWNYGKDRLVITEYDVNLGGDSSDIELVNWPTPDGETLTLTPEQVLRNGITNTVNLRFGSQFPGYVTFFNDMDTINKSGKTDKNTNTIDYTVTINLTDSTVLEYFIKFREDLMHYAEEYHDWGYNNTIALGTAFYDTLPDGWEYVPESLYAVIVDKDGTTKKFNYRRETYPNELQKKDGKQVLFAPLNGFAVPDPFFEMFNAFGSQAQELQFHYTVKATREWLKAHDDGAAAQVHNGAGIWDRYGVRWDDEVDLTYIPNRLTKTAEQEGDSNLVHFTLEINAAGANLDPEKDYLIVTDNSKGLEIRKSSIQVTDGDGNELKKGTDWDLLPEEAEHQFKLKVPDATVLRITYEALIPQMGTDVKVSNEASIDGVDRTDSSYAGSLTVNHIYGGGDGSTYQLEIEKVDSTNNDKKLSGAQFKFYIVVAEKSELKANAQITVGGQTYSCYTEDDWVFATGDEGDEGLHTIKGWLLDPKNYYILEEIEAPEGYETLEEPFLFYYGTEGDEEAKKYTATVVLPYGMLTLADSPIPYTLPETGGIGTSIFLAAGLMFLFAGGAALTVKKRLHQAG